MKTKRLNKILTLLSIMTSISIATALVLYALRQNINLFYTPTQLVNEKISHRQGIRVGGLVKKGSVHYSQDGKQVSFQITDTRHDLIIIFSGLLPALFREGQGIVAQGKIDLQGHFIADQVLAKHDENYRPPEVTAALKEART